MFLARGEEGEQDSDVPETLSRLNIGSAEENNNQDEEEKGRMAGMEGRAETSLDLEREQCCALSHQH